MCPRSVRAPRTPSANGEHRGRPYLIWWPDSRPPWPAMVIVHGAGSRKENHADFARACAASGWAAIAYDQGGHGESADEMSGGAVDDAITIAELIAGREGVDPARVCIRGSSLGGLVAIHAAAAGEPIAAAIAICPANEAHLLRGLRERRFDFRAGERARAELAAWLERHDLGEAVAGLGPKPLLLIHARGDDRVPYDDSVALRERAVGPCELILLAGGDHHSAQHDAELHGVALGWIERRLAAGDR